MSHDHTNIEDICSKVEIFLIAPEELSQLEREKFLKHSETCQNCQKLIEDKVIGERIMKTVVSQNAKTLTDSFYQKLHKNAEIQAEIQIGNADITEISLHPRHILDAFKFILYKYRYAFASTAFLVLVALYIPIVWYNSIHNEKISTKGKTVVASKNDIITAFDKKGLVYKESEKPSTYKTITAKIENAKEITKDIKEIAAGEGNTEKYTASLETSGNSFSLNMETLVAISQPINPFPLEVSDGKKTPTFFAQLVIAYKREISK